VGTWHLYRDFCGEAEPKIACTETRVSLVGIRNETGRPSLTDGLIQQVQTGCYTTVLAFELCDGRDSWANSTADS
jgi:hypothetical protein